MLILLACEVRLSARRPNALRRRGREAGDRFSDDASFGVDDRREVALGELCDGTAGVRGELRPLLGVQPAGRVDHEARRLQGVLPDGDFHLTGEVVPAQAAGPHRGVDLLAVGDQRIARERLVVLPARELADASGGAVHGTQPRGVALTPDDLLVVGGRELAAVLDQRAVRVEQQLRVVDGAAVSLVDTDRDDHLVLPGGLADGVGLLGRYRHRFVQ
jgi:hypothetical protein